MNIIFKNFKNIYFKIFLIRPKLLSTFIFVPFLYILGWFLAQPFILLGIETEKISLIGTIFTFFIFLISMPNWFKFRWGLRNSWQILGVKKIDINIFLSFYFFLKGFLYSVILMSVILIPIVLTQAGKWNGRLSPDVFMNAIILILGIGFTEELIFRGWLLEDFKNQFGFKKALIFQASIFSIVHIGFDLPIWHMLSILIGLFLLGIFLSFLRIEDKNSLWGCIGLHGGLVGLWFLANNGLIEISKDAPTWLVGPGKVIPNPLGGLLGITLMITLCFNYFLKLKRKKLFKEL